MRLLQTLKAASGNKAKIYWDSDLKEYVVKFYNHLGTHMDASDYFTPDRADAFGVAGMNEVITWRG